MALRMRGSPKVSKFNEMHEQHDFYEDEGDHYSGLGRLARDIDPISGSDDESSGDEDPSQTQTVDFDALEVFQEDRNERRRIRSEQPPPTSRSPINARREGLSQSERSRSAGGVRMFTNPLGMGSRSVSTQRSASRPLSRLAQQSSKFVNDVIHVSPPSDPVLRDISNS